MGLEEFTFAPEAASRFVELEYAIYWNEQRWIPPRRSARWARMQPSFWFYRKPGNDHRHFLATANGRAAGRISAYWNSDLRNCDGMPVGMIGDFECINDWAVARDLVAAATSWLTEKHRTSKIWGPMTFDIWHGYRFKTGGFEFPPFLGEPQNMPYYPELFERFGFVEKQRWDSVELVGREDIHKVLSRGKERYNEVIARGYRFESISPARFREDARQMHRMVVDSFSSFLGATPCSEEAFLDLLLAQRAAIDPRFFLLGYDEFGKPCGFVGAFRDLAGAVRSMQGEDSLLARLRFIIDRRRARRMIIYFGGMTRWEGARHSGFGRALFHRVVSAMAEAGVDDVIVALRAEGNPARAYLGPLNRQRIRTYALYEWSPAA